MKRLLLLLIFPFLGCIPSKNTLKSYSQIEKMKNSALLVRLDWPAEKIESLRQFGHTQRAEKIEARYSKRNQKIAWAFSDFIFCPVYYFFIDPDYELTDFNPVDLILHNERLELVSLDEPLTNYFFGQFTTRTIIENNENEESVHGFEILTRNLYPMTDPFPGFERITLLGSAEYYRKSILRLEGKLEKFYQKKKQAQKKTDN